MVSAMNGTCKFEGNSGTKDQNSGMNTGVVGSNIDEVRVFSKEDEDLKSETDAGVSGSARSEAAGASFGSDSDCESRDVEVTCDVSGVNRFVTCKNDPIGAKEEEFDRNDGRNERLCEGQGQMLSRDRTVLDEFDANLASEQNERRNVGLSRDLSYVFEVGDMVWGKVKSHPWWPGHIFNEAFASPSVRRTRREGHVLVAFFGDSSYGWFEPAELIPFDEYFADKSRQTNSRTFLKAVEEAVDEASRRRGLGLVCKCRNSNNFRVTYIPDYFAVDVPEYEPGGVYSINQIRKARSSFKPNETLAFVKHLAVDPLKGDPSTSSFIQNKATLHAYRRAVFEQHDETYSEAFGIQQRSLTQLTEIDQHLKVPPKAPLSGPLVIAEALGGGKSSTMSMKVNDHSKKNKYLFKRREEPNNSSEFVSTTSESNRGKPNIPIPLAYVEESSDTTGTYLIQKRSPAVLAPPQAQLLEYEQKEPVSVNVVPSIPNVSGNDIEGMDWVVNSNSTVNQDIAVDSKPPNGEKEHLSSMPQYLGEEDLASTRIIGSMPDPVEERAAPYPIYDISRPSQLKSEIPVDIKSAESTKLSRPPNQPEQKSSADVDEDSDTHNIKGGHTLMSVAKKSADVSGIDKVKHHKRPPGDSPADSSVILRKKKKMVSKTQANSDPSSKQIDSGKWAIEKQSKKSGPVILSARDDIQVAPLLVNAGGHDSLMNIIKNADLQQVLNDLHALALHPFHGFEENIIDNVLLLILRFRSLFYQKSLVSSLPVENESSEVHVTKFQTGVAVLRSGEHVRPSPPVKHVKNIVRLNDPTKSGRKRPLSDRQEDIAAKKEKKINDVRILATEKKIASQKVLEVRRESKELMQATQKFAKPNSVKRVETPAKMEEPTMLVIKCPPQTSLPSLAELKARFARFGPLDQSGLRVFWKTSTCRVVFLRKHDAEAAYKYTASSNTLFGGARVRCFLRGVADPTNEVPEGGKLQVDYNIVETSKLKDPLELQQQTSVLSQQSPGKSSIQLKSCLKKSSIDETYQVGGNGGGVSSKGTTPRVKFMLGGEESRREQLTVDDRDYTSTSLLDGGTSSVALDYNSKNVHNFVSQAQMSVPPTPPQFAIGPQNNLHNSQTEPRYSLNFINPSTSSVTTATTVDISQQMLFLLTRCNDVVINLTGLLGYVPYHPL